MITLPPPNRPKFSLAPRWPGGEGRVRGAAGHAPSLPTSPSRRGACPRAAVRAGPWATGPSLSPQRAERG
jgi:hypothetical protein